MDTMMETTNGERDCVPLADGDGTVESLGTGTSESRTEVEQHSDENQDLSDESGKIGFQELPRSGSVKSNKERFEKRPERMEKSAPDDLVILSETGSLASSKESYESALVRDKPPSQASEDLMQFSQTGVASSTRAAFEKGDVRNASKKIDDEEDARPEAGSASQTRAAFESGEVIHAKARNQRELDNVEETPNAGSTAVVKEKIVRAMSTEKQEKRLSYVPEKGAGASARAKYEQTAAESGWKKSLSQDDEDEQPQAGAAKNVKERFEKGHVIRAEENQQDSWKEELPPAGTAQASKDALVEAATKGHLKTQVEDDIPGPGYIASTKSRLEEEVDGKKVLQKEEALVSPGVTKENKSRFENVESLLKSPERTIDKEKEELSAVTPGMTKQTKHLLDQEANKIPPKMIDSEDFTGVGGAKKTAADIEGGKLVKPVAKMIESEDLPCGGISQAGMANFTAENGH